MAVPVLVTTWNNTQWLQRCLISLLRNTQEDHLGGITVVGPEPIVLGPLAGHPKITTIFTPPTASALDKIRGYLGTQSLNDQIALYLQDDVLILPGRPTWLSELAQPMIRDPFVAASSAVVTSCGMPHMTVRMALPPGPYYSSAFMMICCVMRIREMRDALSPITEDLFCDQEPALNLLEAGHKIVINTHVPVYHEGMQSNLRCFGGDDPKAWIETCRARIREEVPKRHSAVWIRRLEALEMVPMEQFYIQRGPDAEIRLA